MLIGRVIFGSAIQVGQKGTHFVSPGTVRMSEYMVCVHSKALIGGLRHVRCPGRCKGMGTTLVPERRVSHLSQEQRAGNLDWFVEFAG